MRKFFLFLLISLAAPAFADDGAAVRLWLEKMSAAERYLNFEGNFIYINGPNVETMSIVHAFDQFGERERLSTITGKEKELVTDDQNQFFVVPDKKLVLVDERASLSEQMLSGLSSDNPNYEYFLEGIEQVADYDCQVISIVPRDAYRYGYRLCLEKETGLMLKSQVLDKSGQPQEQLVFTRLTLPESVSTVDLQVRMRQPEYKVFTPKTVDGPAKELNEGWLVGDLPTGMRVVSVQNREVPDRGAVQHLVLDDGIATVSVFISPAQARDRKEITTAGTVVGSGALNVLSLLNEDWRVTVMGAVPAPTLRSVAAAIERKQSD